jgi:hypothetical protein
MASDERVFPAACELPALPSLRVVGGDAADGDGDRFDPLNVGVVSTSRGNSKHRRGRTSKGRYMFRRSGRRG